MYSENKIRVVRTSGNARPRVSAAIAFCKYTLTSIRFNLVEALFESIEFKICPSFDVTLWRTR